MHEWHREHTATATITRYAPSFTITHHCSPLLTTVHHYSPLFTITTTIQPLPLLCLASFCTITFHDSSFSLALPQAVDVLTHTLNHHHAGSNVDFTENELAVVSGRIRDMSTSGGGAPRVNVDHVIELVMCRWSTKMRDREVDLRKTFRAGDVDLNNVLSFGKWVGGKEAVGEEAV
jgi:hypothetical protein